MWTKSTVLGLILGQLLSLLVAFTGFTSCQLAKKGISAPYSLNLVTYLLMSYVYGSIMCHRAQNPKAKPYLHSALTFFDVLAKSMVTRAYKFTSLTSVMLLDCWTIPCVVLFSWLFLNTKYGPQKLLGLVICVLGLVSLVLSDLQSDRLSVIEGDLSVIYGATLYGVRYVCEEIYFKEADRVEIMAFLGSFGAVAACTQVFLFEPNEWNDILSSTDAMFLVFGFSLSTVLFYMGVPLLLEISGSKLLNKSLLTSNIWAVIIRIFAYNEKVGLIYFTSFATVTLGLLVYSGIDEIYPKSGEAVNIDEEALLVHSDNDGSRISFEGTMRYPSAIDMWTVGCIVAELLLKKIPFRGKTDIDQID